MGCVGLIENPAIKAQEILNDRVAVSEPTTLYIPCACGKEEAAAIDLNTNQKYCRACLEGICGVRLLD
jgi:hypothetical protein